MTDEVSLTIAADRFANLPPGCPDIVDSLADTLVLSNGVSVQGGAKNMPAVVGQWQTWLSKADYVLLSPGHGSLGASPGPPRSRPGSTRSSSRRRPIGGHRAALPALELHPASRLPLRHQRGSVSELGLSQTPGLG